MNLLFALILLQDIEQPQYQQKEIEIRGFLHELPEGDLVLSSLPNTRSCCAPGKTPCLVIRGQLPPFKKCKAVTLKGTLISKEDHYELLDAVLFD